MPIGVRVTDLPAAADTLDDDDEFLVLEDSALRRGTKAQTGPKAANVSVADTANQFTGVNVETVLAEIQDNVDALVISGGGISVASEAEALAGTNNTKAMTPLRVKGVLPYVNAREFGATGDGTTDDTVALQAWLDYLTANHRLGWLPNGTYKITDALVTESTYGWGIWGESRSNAIIRQHTANTPCIQLGDTLGSQIQHSLQLRNFHLTHNTAQPAANTAAVGLLFYTMTYYSTFDTLQFSNLAHGMRAPGTGAEFGPWGCRFDDLIFGTFSISAINWSGASSTCPNNHFGRMTINCGGATGPIVYLLGDNCIIDALEFLDAEDSTLLEFAAGNSVKIGSVKLELATYTVGPRNLISFDGATHSDIGSFLIYGTYCDFEPVGGLLAAVAVAVSATTPSYCHIGTLRFEATSIVEGVGAIIADDNAHVDIDNVAFSGGWVLTSNAYSESSNSIRRVGNWDNGFVSADKGNADYTVTVGDPSIVRFNTAFTAARTITLPAALADNVHGGQTYRFIFNGAVNGANTAVIKQGATTIHTETNDKRAITFTYMRSASGWVMTGYETLP